MAWDGTTMWMLPRAARALQGLSFLFQPLVVDLITTSPSRMQYLHHGHGSGPLLVRPPSKSPTASLPQYNLPVLETEARTWVDQMLVHGSRPQTLLSQRPSILSGFTTLMHYVFYQQYTGTSISQMLPDYNTCEPVSYEDTYEPTPRLQYQWNEAFNHGRLRTHVMHSNMNDVDEWIRADSEGYLRQHGIACGDQLNHAQRMTFASTVKDLLAEESDIRLAVLLPTNFATYANELITETSLCGNIWIGELMRCLMSCNASEEQLILYTRSFNGGVLQPSSHDQTLAV
ncbi:hypothetical protein C8R46DRAFT_1030632 [Mycena filopes]|nr:hypothetical protein C8R46DRAFT_1030632 [Mycena filopes]